MRRVPKSQMKLGLIRDSFVAEVSNSQITARHLLLLKMLTLKPASRPILAFPSFFQPGGRHSVGRDPIRLGLTNSEKACGDL
jgi:hypothetical protein